ncbi:pyridoxal phosphate-dependent aminotransferase [Nocardioides sp. Kera G14]|uniref:pyridoxal phosphate-dependent aminotransferase n=1 Tax=Nocardioides sp. Kera G14 TaxID=2884264 RepID=UPI001D12EAAB|nr:pyridoxal phosphate-dependent aminotransferase [Nocardioides sp. Kera G14]UDY23183.1 pyridoxal phosphate-dependent aminotransferase [Nocardioides sp. Kera G14]
MVASRLSGIPPTVFGEMSALAMRTGAINLGQGFPDVDGPSEVLDAVERALRSGSANQYPPARGIPALRSAIAAHQERHYGLALDPDTEVVVTTGATEAIAAALLGLVEPGDEVVVLEPFYDSYPAVLQMAGGVRRPVTLHAPDFRLDVDALRAAVTDRTRFVLLNTPHNPTGAVLTRGELTAVADLAIEHDLVVISDEVYEHLTYGEATHVPIATLPGMRERTLTISSIGKSFSFTGWKIGWASGPAHLVDAVNSAKQWLTFVSGGPLQPAAAYALDECDAWPRALAADLRERRDLLVDGLNRVGLSTRSPEGTYFAISDVSGLGWRDGLELCRALPERAGVVAIPLQVFYDSTAGDQLIRWAFCKRPEVLGEALERLAGADLRCGQRQ